MKRRFLMTIVLLIVLIVSACQTAPAAQVAPTTAPAATSASAPANSDAILIISNDKEQKNLTLDEIKKLPAVEGQAGIKSSTGKITLPAKFRGVLLSDLLKLVGGADSKMGVQLNAKDGYGITFSVDQIINGDFVTYDPSTGDEIKNAGKLQTILAYEMDGKPLDPQMDGYLRLAVISEKPNQVVDGHWAVKWINKVDIKAMAEEWTLRLEGTRSEDMDRATFESGTAEKCHQTIWKDGKAQDWTGIPLWLLMGRIDDENKHGDGAFNDKLADKGYTVEVVGKDGMTATFDSARIKRNNNIIVALLVNGNPLTDADFPLKLVGSDLKPNEMVNGIQKIAIKGIGTPTAEPTAVPTAATSAPAATANAALTLSGKVEKEQAWSLEDLKKLEVVKQSVEHPKKGKMDVEGVRFSTLLEIAKVKTDAKSLVLSASDGYKVEVDLKAVNSCKDCMVSFETPNGLNAVMPEMESSAWVKNLAKIEIK
jgi:DMSO/TMAO reductase YedYZ molybdopterin-dependent catalytic subunit